MSNIYPRVYFKNKFIDFKEANLSIGSAPVLYGLSSYTVIPVFLSEDKKSLNIFRLRDHFERLINSSKILNFGDFISAYDYSRFEKIILRLLTENEIQNDSLIRVTVFVDELLSGAKSIGLKNSLSVFIYPMTKLINKKGADLMISSYRRTPDNSIPARAKVNGGYVNSALAKNEAILNNYDDAIFLDQDGHLTESTISNIFLVRNNFLITPPQNSDLLEGITRSTVIDIAKENKIKVIQRTIDRTEIYLADELFLSGSSLFIQPVFRVDHVNINNRNMGSITNKISHLFRSLVRENNSKNKWVLNKSIK
ncbi:MAG: aminotransferase class IV [Patescibacteria group bacterium]|jgi:branched-chain amino acid aminotransferase|nr:aminotransferase class IV [Patescibacteria group bacterium]